MNTTVIAAIIAVFASTGFWAFVQKLFDKRSAWQKLLMGIAYSKICDLALKYIGRGYITKEEYADLKKYLYEPYRDMGGNGTCARLMAEVDKLPIKED